MDQSMSFDIDNNDYKMFIKDLRKLLPQSRSHGFLVVAPQAGPLRWLDVELIVGVCRIILRLDQRTLYVRGYSRNGDTYFWEFCDDDSPLIDGSRNLGYSGSYDGRSTSIATSGSRSLGYSGRYAGGLTGTALIGRENLLLGYHPLKNAIISLAATKDPATNQVQSARSLLTMIQMITEAARIELIAEHIVLNWWCAKPITLRMVELENAWGTPSYCEVALGSWTRTLVSIECVRVKSINRESPGQVYGYVTVADSARRQIIYNRILDNAESKGPGDCISLTGPHAAIFGEDPFNIRVCLQDRDTEFAMGDVSWDRRDKRLYDIIQVEDVSGKYGSVSVEYVVMTEALSATVAVVLINGDRESPIDIYGTIKAMIDGPQYHSDRMLFDKSEDEYVQVRCQEESIPLTDVVFPASVNSYITIQANLWGRRDILHPYDHILEGSVHFTPTVHTQHKIVTGKYGEVVKVSITCD